MPCHAMHPIQDLFLEGFSYVLQFDMHFIRTPMWTKFYSCEKWVLQRWSRSTVELLLLLLLWLELRLLVLSAIAPILLLLRSTQLTPKWGMYHTVLKRSIARTTTDIGSRHHPLPLLLIVCSNSLQQPLLINGGTRQLIVQQADELSRELLQVDGKPFMYRLAFFSSIST
jgi:hypothetical protein